MDFRHSSPARRTDSLRPNTQRQRSNSFPIVEALGCSTPEAQLILAEGRAAVRRRRGRRNRSFDDDDEETPTAFNPKDHMKYLMAEQPALSEARSCHARIPSNATDRSTSTIVAVPRDSRLGSMASPTGPLGNYSAHLAQFIKAQLKSIPTYQSEQEFVTNLSPQSCPEFSFPAQSPPLSPRKSMRRAMEVPQSIPIPPVRPPMRSAFSAWSSTDDDDEEEEDEEVQSLPEIDEYTMDAISKISTYTPSVLGYYEGNNNASFMFSSSPLEGDDGPDTARGQNFAVQPAPTSSASESYDGNDYPSSSFSRPLHSSSSAPSYPSSAASASSYFNCKRPFADGPITTDRIIAALTPPRAYGKTISAVSPWEGGAISNVHDVFIDSQQRVHVDGMSFDMLGNFIAPDSVTTPC